MEKKLNLKAELFFTKFKDDIREKLIKLKISENDKANDLLEYVCMNMTALYLIMMICRRENESRTQYQPIIDVMRSGRMENSARVNEKMDASFVGLTRKEFHMDCRQKSV